MTSRTTTITATGLTALAIAAALTACAPTPEPTPTPTGFASEAEAFAAAEATYRAYVDATNAARADPSHSPSPESFLRGEALEDEIEAARQLTDLGLSISGETVVSEVRPKILSQDRVAIEVCLDSSRTRLIDQEGTDVTPSRETPTLVNVELVHAGDYYITSSTTQQTGSC
ncbi:hypothetical protein RZO50_13885 [Microbacterium sp. SSW1-59]|uniref:hypothetical protein n=1 Tax=Microbacterium xanthum TaxID=3079794 RepID=UPI002AD51EDE|nr:hypothetical protein [Microbacterium sp. SSW1-59]MDZ8202606.1 hypothetical protein [Microbacterium sp. SSW1-59]